MQKNPQGFIVLKKKKSSNYYYKLVLLQPTNYNQVKEEMLSFQTPFLLLK